MKVFHCSHCQRLVFFENVHCVSCGHLLAFLPELQVVGALEPAGIDLWRSQQAPGVLYQRCENYGQQDVCNWAVSAEDRHPLCRSCRLTRLIPDLSQWGNREAWYRLEVAKRRLIYALLGLGLPLQDKATDPQNGLAFEFVAHNSGSEPVLTGHSDGVITINIAEADDAERENRRLRLHEPYRTLLGHFRHEIGHYYWDQRVRHSAQLSAFRELFGDEREDYGGALKRNYEQGPPNDWQQWFVSSYASAHPWEDWAETWAHYLHMIDALETASACGLSLRPRRSDEPSFENRGRSSSFDQMLKDWFPLTYVLNNLNRGMGLPDGYPFVLPSPAIEKLRFVHEVIKGASNGKS